MFTSMRSTKTSQDRQKYIVLDFLHVSQYCDSSDSTIKWMYLLHFQTSIQGVGHCVPSSPCTKTSRNLATVPYHGNARLPRRRRTNAEASGASLGERSRRDERAYCWISTWQLTIHDCDIFTVIKALLLLLPAEAVAVTLRKALGNGAVLKMEQNVFIPKAV